MGTGVQDGEAVGTPVPAAYDPSSEEPPVTHGGARKSVGPPPTGAGSNASDQVLFHNTNDHTQKKLLRARESHSACCHTQ